MFILNFISRYWEKITWDQLFCLKFVFGQYRVQIVLQHTLNWLLRHFMMLINGFCSSLYPKNFLKPIMVLMFIDILLYYEIYYTKKLLLTIQVQYLSKKRYRKSKKSTLLYEYHFAGWYPCGASNKVFANRFSSKLE